MAKNDFNDIVLTHLDYIKKAVDENTNQLKIQNGRIRKTENSLSWIKGIGVTVTFVISSIVAFLFKE
tara:strand:- start:295 stop:495 length:201 start_codon:yes stop_codon:yes gene_type:complete